MKGTYRKMAYNYLALKLAAKSNEPIGKWNGVPVYACAKADLYMKDDRYFYVVYDDNNALVRDNERYGTVMTSGNVQELSRVQYYSYPEPGRKPGNSESEGNGWFYDSQRNKEKTEPEVSPGEIPLVDAGANEFFEKLNAEIDALLATQFNFEGMGFES